MIPLLDCPNPECLTDLVTWESSDTGAYYILCSECQMESPIAESADDASLVWNGLPRHDEEDEDEDEDEDEEDGETIATLVRMLDETRTFHEDLKDNYNDLLERYNKRKLEVFGMAYGKDIELIGSQVLTDMKERIDELVSTCDQYERAVSKAKEELGLAQDQRDTLGKDLRRERDRSTKAEMKSEQHNDVLTYIDRFLVGLNLRLVQGREIVRSDEVTSFQRNFLHVKKARDISPSSKHTFAGALDELIHLSSPFSQGGGRPGVYRRCIEALEGDDAEKMSAYGVAMAGFPKGTRGYDLSWKALGCPGKTPDVRHPHT